MWHYTVQLHTVQDTFLSSLHSSQVIKKLGDNGLLGPTREVEYGGVSLDYSYSMAIAEELGNIRCMGVPMAIGVHTGILTHIYLSSHSRLFCPC